MATASGFRDSMIGENVGGCEILEPIGGGALGYVFKAQHLTLEKIVAVKVLGPKVNNSPEYVKRFKREAKIAGSIEHPNVIPIYGVGDEHRFPYIIMRYIEGASLYRVLTRDGLDQLLATKISEQIGMALGAVHKAGYVHRDVKPENILLSHDGQAFLSDFGVASKIDKKAATLSGGSPPYMSPEQARGDHVDGRSDLYSLGVMFYQMLCGRRPFLSTSYEDLLEMHQNDDYPPLASLVPSLIPELVSLVDRLLAKDPDHRPHNAEEFVNELRDVQELLRVIRRKRSLTVKAKVKSADISAIRKMADGIDPSEREMFDDQVEEVEIGLLIDTTQLRAPVIYQAPKDEDTVPYEEPGLDLGIEVDLDEDEGSPINVASLTGKERRALENLNQVIEKRPGDARLLVTRAKLRAKADDHDGAEVDFKRALQLDPGYVKGLIGYAVHLQELGRNGDAETHLKMAIDLEPNNVEACIALGKLYQSYGAMGLAKKYFERAIFFVPSDERGHVALGCLSLVSDKEDQARESFAKALELNPSFGPALYWNAWVKAKDNEEPATIIELLKQALRSGLTFEEESLDDEVFKPYEVRKDFKELRKRVEQVQAGEAK